MRAADVKLREFRGVKWLFADANVAPDQILDAVQRIVAHREIAIRGMLLTLKLLDANCAVRLPEFAARVASWEFSRVLSRQLAFNRREVCLAAMKSRGR
jgi:23S rRNA (cytidine2498-2'-O)-methyltransferase